MPTQADKKDAPPFDQGLFLLHYNKGRELFQEQDLEAARKELEAALRLRPNDGDVLNLLGLIYFKGNFHEEAERIYRKLLVSNPDVFILHSNLGLVLFKQTKLEEAEKELLRSIDLKPNYTKSHLYLGLLYKQKGKLGLAQEHLQFAGATKALREVEEMLRKSHGSAAAAAAAAGPRETARAGTAPVMSPPLSTVPATRPVPRPPAAPSETAEIPRVWAAAAATPPAPPVPTETPRVPMQAAPPAVSSADTGVIRAVESKLGHAPLLDSIQRATEEGRQTEVAPRSLPLATLPGAVVAGVNRTFLLKENGYLEITSTGTVYVKRGTVSTYTGNLRFLQEKNLSGTSAATMVRVDGQGKLFLYEKGRRIFLIDLDNEFIYVEGHNLLAMEESLAFRKEPIYDYSRNRKIEAIKIYGRGSLAVSTAIEPLTLRVTKDFPLNLSSESLVAWTGDLIPTVLDDAALAEVMTTTSTGFRIRFEGQGVVVAEEA
jgi:uncharacterized protein (AIM24 family)